MLFTVTLILALIGIIAGFVMSKKGDERGSMVMSIAAVLGMTVGLAHLFLRGAGGVEQHPIKVQEWRFASIAAERLGLHLTEALPQASALIIMPLEMRTTEDRRKAMLEGLTRALKDKITVFEVVDPELPPAVRLAYESRQNPDMEQLDLPDLATWFNAAYFDKLLAENPGDYTLVISLAGLPEDGARMQVLRRSRPPKFATTFAPLYQLHPLMTDGHLVADVQQHPSPNPQAEPPDEDIIPSFERRYMLITPANMAELKQKYPELY